MTGYSFTIDHVEYVGYKDGTPFSLADCWREVEGVYGARIWCGDRLVVDNAGAATTRRYEIRARYQAHREAARLRRIESYAALNNHLKEAA